MKIDYLIVGSGLTGAIFARLLQEAGHSVLIVDRRSHVGGNVHDHEHESGIRIHTYGPHYFRTVSEEIWQFITKFGEFYPYSACLKSRVDGKLENWPIAASYIQRAIGLGWKPEFQGVPANFEDAALALMPRAIYEKFVKGYTEKQWGVPAKCLSAELCKRFDIRADDDPRLTPRAKYQGLPLQGYAALMKNMLAGIPVTLDCDYISNRDSFHPTRMTIFTGPIDEFFGFSLGKLKYRGQKRVTEYLEQEIYQETGQVNDPAPEAGPHIRTLEWKHMMPETERKTLKGTVITREITVSPENPENYEYPFPDEINRELYQSYRKMADEAKDVLICGRLGEYKYYDMDHAIARAMTLTRRLLQGQTPAEIIRGDK